MLYTKDAHQRLLEKHPEDGSRQFIENMEHLRTLQRPDVRIDRTYRDKTYLKEGVNDSGDLGKTSIKPIPEDNQSYINTAYVISDDKKIAKELAGNRGVPAPGSETTAVKNFTFDGQNGADVDTTVAKTGENVNTDLRQAYRRRGDAFYDKLTDEQQLRYETMLDNAPRDAQGRYTDPITGETWIDEVVEYDGRKAVQLDDYVTDTAPEGEGRRGHIRKQIMDKFAGKDITLSNNDTARVGRQEAGKLAGASYREQPELHTDAKINSSMYVDELGATMDNIRISSNVKSGEQNAPAYIKGDVTIISRGVPYDAELIIRQLQDGTKRIYDVVIKQEAAPSSRAQSFNEHLVIRDGLNGGTDTPWVEPLGADSNGAADGYSGESVAKTSENVNATPGKQMELGLDNGRPLEWQDNGLQDTMRKSRQINARVKKAMQQEQHIVIKDATADEIAQEFVKNTPIKNLGDVTIAMLDDPKAGT